MRVLATFFLAAVSVGIARAQDASIPPDSLVRLGTIQLVNGRIDSAETLFRRALAPGRHAGASVGLGRALLERGNEAEARRMFEQADTWDRNKGHKSYGEGLIAKRAGRKDQAKAKFQETIRRNRQYVDALVQLGEIQSEGFLDRFSARRTLRRAAELEPRHPSVHYLLGALHNKSGDADAAIPEFEEQLRINPDHPQTMIELGYALLEKGRYWHARQRLFEALQNSSGNEADLTLALAATYMGDRQFARAHDSYAQALQMLPEEERALYESIDDVGDPQEVGYANRVSGEPRLTFLKKFWLRRDPTPVTVVNERLLEHFRRVWLARRFFSEGSKPWDDRGRVYIRYGEPDHRSSSRKPNFARESSVDVIRERYLHQIYGPRPPDVLERGSLPVYPLIDPSLIQQDEFQRQQVDMADQSTPQTDPETGEPIVQSQTLPDVQAPNFGPEAGVSALTRWEEWTYVHVGSGLHVTFVDRVGRNDFRFATPPATSDLRMASTLRQFSPEEQYDVAQNTTPELYQYDATQDPFDFHYYTAQFRAARGTELDIYYGLPTAEIQFQAMPNGTYKAQIQNGFAVFDTLWNDMGRFAERVELVSRERPNQERGSFHVDQRSVLVPGAQRVLLSVQAEDLVSGRLGAYRENVDVVRFDSTRLAMSDIVVAGSIRKADSTDARKFVRNGLSIMPMASRAFLRGQPLYVYFEAYNLTRGKDYGETEYEVEHAIRSGGSAGGSILGSVGRILGGTGRRVGVSQVIEGIRSAEYQNFQIDTASLAPGTYTLLITVHDLKSDQRVTKERQFKIGG